MYCASPDDRSKHRYLHTRLSTFALRAYVRSCRRFRFIPSLKRCSSLPSLDLAQIAGCGLEPQLQFVTLDDETECHLFVIHTRLSQVDVFRRGKWHLFTSHPVTSFFLCLLERLLLRVSFRGPIAAISLAPSARSGRVHAHVKGVVQQAGLKRQVA